MPNLSFPPQPDNQDVRAPLQGLWLDRPAYTMQPTAFSACNNVRIELNRVHSSKMGWQATNVGSILRINGPVIYLADYSNGTVQVPLAVSPTDIYRLDNGQFVTPIYDTGTAAVNNGSTSVAGTGTRWGQDIQYADVVSPTAGATSGSTTISINTQGLPAGISVTSPTNPGAFLPGTYLVSTTSSTVTVSLPTQAALATTDTILFGSNVTLRNNVKVGDQIFFGSASESSPTAAWYTVAAVSSDTALSLTSAYTGSNFSGVYTIRQLLTNTVTTGMGSYTLKTGAALPTCMSANFPDAAPRFINDPYAGNQWLFTNGVDPVVTVSFTGGGNATFARSVPFVCAALTRYKNLMIYGGLTVSTGTEGMSMANSDNSFPYNMAGGVSGQFVVGDGPFYICRLSILGSTLMIYTQGAWAGGPDNMSEVGGNVITASFVGEPTLWVFSTVIQNRGPLAGAAVCEFPDRHQFLAIDGEYRYNGLFIQVMNDHIWRFALKQVELQRSGAFGCLIVPTYGDILWQVPLSSDGTINANVAYVEHYMEQAQQYVFKPFTQRTLPFSALGTQFLPGLQPFYVAGDMQGFLWQLYTSDTANGTPLTSTVTWAARVIGNARSRALVTRVYPSIETASSPTSPIQVSIALTNSLAGPVTITDTQPFDSSYGGQPYTAHYRRGMTVSVTFSNSLGQSFICDGYDLDWQTGGARLT